MSKISVISSKSADNPTKETYQVFRDGSAVGPVHSTRESANAYKRKLEHELDTEDVPGKK